MESLVLKPKALVLSVRGPEVAVGMPPLRRGLKGSGSPLGLGNLCGCLTKSQEPPEITYHVVENGGIINMQPTLLTPTQPIPPKEELDAKFAELVDELDLTAAKKEVIFNLPDEKKWQLYLSKKVESEETSAHFPDYYIDRVNSMPLLLFPREEEEVNVRAKVLDNLKTALRTQPNSFVMRFLELDGLVSLLKFLGSMEYETAQSPIHTSLIGCVKALMNNSSGRAHVLAHPTAIDIIAQSLCCENLRTKVSVLEILGAVCLVSGGHKKVLAAMLGLQKHAAERTRFQTIVNDLDRSTGVYKDEVSLKTAIMSFVNAIINYGPGQDHLEFRLHLRFEFLMLGIQPIVDKLRRHENSTLDRHLDIFEMVRNEDEKELARRFDLVHVDTKSSGNMYELLRRKLTHTAAYPHFLSLLQHCLMLPLDHGACPQHWLLFDRIVQQIVLQGERKENPDVPVIDIDVKNIVQLLASEERLREAEEKATLLEKEHSDMSQKLTKKDHDLDQALLEKEDLQSVCSKLKTKLEKETALQLEATQKTSELEYKLAEVTQLLQVEKLQRSQAESLVKAGSLCDDAKVGLQVPLKVGGVPSVAPPPPPPLPHAFTSSVAPPPPPPPMNGCPPPPPPPHQHLTNGHAPSDERLRRRKEVPQPSNPLKSFNWAKLAECKVNGTVWLELDDAKVYKDIDLGDFDKAFSAYQKQQVINVSTEDISSSVGRPPQPRSREFSVIDGRRAQNCTILLSKLRMSNEDICNVILNMDCKDQMPKDMVEQLLKFTPSAEERAMLDEHSAEIDSMARADRFLFEVSRIVHFEQRLRTLFYKKKFQERISDCQPKIDAVLEASKELQRSKRLRKLLEVILALGNYMNRGQRGNAMGFHLASLNRIADTKSSVHRNMTLLHYIVETLEKKFKDSLKLEDDISHVRQASKVNLQELKKEIKMLKGGLQEVQKEFEFHRSQPLSAKDKFLPVMKDFITTANYKMSDLEDSFQEMNQRYEKVVCRFGEDPSLVPPDEFFGIFDTFLTSFNDAKLDNILNRKKREEEDRRNKILENESKKEKNGGTNGMIKGGSLRHGVNGVNGTRTIGSTPNKGEFDDLISALRTGDVFGEDIAKLRRNRRRGQGVNGGVPGSGGTLPQDTSEWRESSRERVMSPQPQKVKG